MTEVLAYVRVSTTRQGAEGLGADAQRAAIEQAAQARGWTITGWYTDEKSGKSLERPGIQAALRDLENGGPKVLVTAKLDRLARSAIDFLELVRRAEAQGWALVLLDLDLDMTKPTGRLIAGVIAQIAEFERHLIIERTTNALEQAALRGSAHGGNRPFGYQDDRVTPEPAEAALLNEAVTRVLDGDSLANICEDWTQREVPTTSGGTWRPITLRGILTNPRYIGKRVHQGEVIADAVWPALVETERWERLQSLLAGRKRGRVASKHLLSGVLFCAECDDRLGMGTSRGRRLYRTYPDGRGKDSCGANLTIPAEAAEDLMRDAVIDRLSEGIVPAMNITETSDETIHNLQAIDDRLAELNEMWMAGEIDRTERATMRLELTTQREALEAEIVRASAPTLPNDLPASREALNIAWDEASLEWKRQVITALAPRIDVHPINRDRKCQVCGESTEHLNRSAKYCSRACRDTSYAEGTTTSRGSAYSGLTQRLNPQWVA